MAGQNRSSYARNNSANRGLVAFFRGAFLLLVALTLSFGLGFFVIARMVPPNVTDTSGPGGGDPNGVAAPGHNEHQESIHAGSPHSLHQNSPTPAPSPANPHDGPVLLPEGNVQQPEKLEAHRGESNTDATGKAGDADTPDKKDTNDSKTDGDTTTSVSAGSQTTTEGDPLPLKRSHRVREGSDAGAVQQAGSPDSSTDRTTSNATGTGAGKSGAQEATPVKNGLYRVQIGVYSTREKAEEVARSASDKGITTTVHVISRDGRTLYRVQHSAHRDRAKAESDKQKLIDAGLDASIVNPT